MRSNGRRNLDRDVVDIVALDKSRGSRQALRRLAFAEHRFTEQIDVEADPRLLQL